MQRLMLDLWQTINHEILAKPNQIDMYSFVMTPHFLCSLKLVPTQFTVYAFIRHGYD